MKKKLFGFAALLALAGVTLASCGQSTENYTTPTGNLNFDDVIATSSFGDNTFEMKNGVYYNKLRYNGSTLVTNKIKEYLYEKELKAVKNLFTSNTVADLTQETKDLIIPTKNDEKLFTLEGDELVTESYRKIGITDNYGVIKHTLVQSINASLSTAIYSTQDSESIKNKMDSDRDKAVNSFIVSNERKGITLTSTNLNFDYPADEDDFNVISFRNIKEAVLADIVNPYLLTEAEKLSAQNALYQIADEEYIKEYNADEDDSKTKNSNYIFKSSTVEDKYESSYQTFGKYHAVLIQFNSRKEAMETIQKLKDDNGIDFKTLNADDIEAVKNAYIALYNAYYDYKPITTVDSDDFKYQINVVKNDFSDLPDGVTELIKTTLEDNQFLTEPRNINNKYVMALRLSTTYEVSGDDTETTYTDLEKEENANLLKKYTTLIKYNTLISTASSYTTTNFKSMVYERSNNDDKNDDIFIYDPLFEYKFYGSYTDDYVRIDKANFNNNLILKIDDHEYSVADFYTEATKNYASTILTNYFELSYAYTFYDQFIDSDTHDSNVETLETTINTFNAGNNASYDKAFGLENFLLSNYGYTTKDDVIKYYYDAQTCLSSYTSKNVFENWAIKNDDGTYSYDADLETTGILSNLLKEGNKKYSDLFSINLDHFLINIDDDGDGSPDDPQKFLDNMKKEEEQTAFKSAVVTLAKALYAEAIDDQYDGYDLYKILTFIKSQYEEGGAIKSANVKVGDTVCTTWDQFKKLNKYNFLITVEQLASSGDITQATVSNFVGPFADYVKGVFKTIATDDSKTYTNGSFVVYDTESNTGKTISTLADIDEISFSDDKKTLCQTVYGYHLLIVNSYNKAKKTKYTSDDDSSQVQSKIQLLIKEDTDNSDNNIYVTVNSYNDKEDEVSFNQFFIYYIQKANGVESSLSSNISTLLSSMYDDIISTYTSNNFQTVLLLDLLNIQPKDETMVNLVKAERKYYANLVCNYATKSDPNDANGSIYYDWVFRNVYIWERPTK